MKRTARAWFPADQNALLDALRVGREGCVEASRHAPINGPIYKGCEATMAAIDDLVGVLTGDRQHFWLKPHSNARRE